MNGKRFLLPFTGGVGSGLRRLCVRQSSGECTLRAMRAASEWQYRYRKPGGPWKVGHHRVEDPTGAINRVVFDDEEDVLDRELDQLLADPDA